MMLMVVCLFIRIMSRKKTGGKQAGYSKHGEETINLAGRIPKSLFEKFELFPGTKTDKIIHAIKLYIMDINNLAELLKKASKEYWVVDSDTYLFCSELWGDPDCDAGVTIMEDGRYEVTIPSTTEVFDLEGLIAFVTPED